MVRIGVLILIGILSISAYGGMGRSECEELFSEEGEQDLYFSQQDYSASKSRFHKKWPNFIFKRKKEQVQELLRVIFSTKMDDSRHRESIEKMLSIVQNWPGILEKSDIERLESLFIHSTMKRNRFHYDTSTARLFALILKESIPQDSSILFLFAQILREPQHLWFFNASTYSHLLVREIAVSVLRNYVEGYPEFLSLLERQLTEMGDFYIDYPNAHKNQTMLLQTAVENIVTDVGQLASRYPSVMLSLFKRLFLLYENKSSSYEDSALIEKHRITIKMIREHFQPSHILFLARNENENVRKALVKFFTRDFHSLSPEILEEVEKLLVYQQQAYVREAGISILAGRELSGKGNEPYISHHFEESIERLQPPTIAPSRLSPGSMRLIYELSQRDSNSNVRQLAQQVVDLTRNRKDLKGYINEAQ